MERREKMNSDDGGSCYKRSAVVKTIDERFEVEFDASIRSLQSNTKIGSNEAMRSIGSES